MEFTNSTSFPILTTEFNLEDIKIERRTNVRVALIVSYSVIIICGLLTNLFVCFVLICKYSSLVKKNYIFLNLAVADMLLIVLCAPFTLVYVVLDSWVFGDAMCHILPLLQSVSVFTSTFSLTSVAVDRHNFVFRPLGEFTSTFRCTVSISVIWTMAILLSIPMGVNNTTITVEISQIDHVVSICSENWPYEYSRTAYTIAMFFIQFVIPVIIMCILYARISVKIRNRVTPNTSSESLQVERVLKEEKRNRKVNFILLLIIVLFAVCWLPINIFNILCDIYFHTVNNRYFTISYAVCHMTAMSSASLNPILYGWTNEYTRNEAKAVFRWCCCRCRCPAPEMSSVSSPDNPRQSPDPNHVFIILADMPRNMT
ncbi:prolactin-releasing peptide receptor-like [Saccoglossus kowalevskii]|uniref:Neuropeptide Y receptor type 5-like n=1 Tax=Saccoglossus kowalevskii TaxID=10224 RepID=A0ABM0MB64_SACKO|nr:PREDICTED: neuropeptide Y receptor type 5-like [Saccoglossus kowalevskii]